MAASSSRRPAPAPLPPARTGCFAEQRSNRAAIGPLPRPPRCLADGIANGMDLLGMGVRPSGPERQHFFGAVPYDLEALMQNHARACAGGERIPRRADAKPVEAALAKGVDHIGRRHDNEADVFTNIDLAGAQPKPQLVMMRREG